MFRKTLVLSALLTALTSAGAGAGAGAGADASPAAPDSAAELQAQRENLSKRLDAVKTKLGREPGFQEGRKLAQWPNWSDFRNSWGNFGNW